MEKEQIRVLASLMKAGREPDNEKPAPPGLLNSSRLFAYGTLLGLSSLASNGLCLESERAHALENLRATAPFSSCDLEGTFGLKEVVSVRRGESLPVNATIAADYLTALLVKKESTFVIVREGDYRSQVDSKGAYQPDKRVKLLQHLVMGEQYADGLLGPKTARAFRLALEESNRAGLSSCELPAGESLHLTVGMAEALITYAMNRSREARVAFQTALEERGYVVGPSGRDGVLGTMTELAAERLQSERGLPRKTSSITPQAVAAAFEEVPTVRAGFAKEMRDSDWFQGLPVGWQRHLEELHSELNPEELAAFRSLINSPAFEQMRNGRTTSHDEPISSARALQLQCRLFQVFTTADSEGRCHFVNLCYRTAFNGEHLVLFDSFGGGAPGVQEKCVLDFLYDLAVDSFTERDEPYRVKILSGALAELDPFNINQGHWGRCGGDVIQFDLNLRYPARALSLVVKGFSLEKAGEDSAPGARPIDQVDGYTPYSVISPTEARIQAYFMEIGDKRYRYDAERDCQVDRETGERMGAGLFDSDIARLTSEITGEQHLCYSASDGVSPAALALLLRAAEPGDKFAYLSRYYTQQEFLQLSEAERQGRTTVRSSHIVNFVSFDQERGEVLFRTWGRAPAPDGTWLESQDGSLRKRVVDQERGIYATKIAEDLMPVISGVILRKKEGVPAPESIDYPWKFPDLIPFVVRDKG